LFVRLDELIKALDVKAPDTGNALGEAYAFNLMFPTQIGPTGKVQGYLRPETAQGIFVNFRRLLDANGGRMPFAAAQVGCAFRNEISPRMGLLRVREFVMSEIEHFVNPNNKRHPKFNDVKDCQLTLLSRADQTGADVSRHWTAGEAVKQGIIDNETLAYFMVRTHLFLVAAGIKPAKLRYAEIDTYTYPRRPPSGFVFPDTMG
jgi:glycyl-tRNA synthetase